MTPDLQEAKRSLRDALRRALAGVRPETAHAWSAAVGRNVLGWDVYRRARTVMAFLPIGGEPDLTEVCRAALAEGKRLALPRVDWSAATMTAAHVVHLDRDVVSGRRGLREPGARAPAIPASQLDVILVPGLGFDAQGRRLGRGAGYYDRFLAGLSAVSAGVAFEVQLVDEVPAGPGDVPVQAIVTERRIVQAGAGRAPLR